VWISIAKKWCNLEIAIKDDGKGVDEAALNSRSKSKRFGLFRLRERLTHIGGLFNIESQSGKGTRVTLVAPLDLK